MKFHHLFVCAAVVLSLCGSLRSQTGSVPIETRLSVDRYTDLGAVTDSKGVVTGYKYRYEMGTLYSDGSGFVPSYVTTYEPSTISTYDPTRAEILAVSGQCVVTLNNWNSFADLYKPVGVEYLQNYSRSTATYSLKGVPHVVVTVKGNSTGSGGGGGTIVVSGSGPRLLNMSFRAVVPANGKIIPGFVVADTDTHDSLKVLVRVAGPTLGSFGVSGTLADPKITVYDSKSAVIATNDNWGDNAGEKTNLLDAATKTGAFPLQDGSKDAAVVLTLKPGSYTAAIEGPKDAAGEVLVEVYAVEK